jgi:mannitol/fructose-specific phosphotransferase system IIA component (Ntr-type)
VQTSASGVVGFRQPEQLVGIRPDGVRLSRYSGECMERIAISEFLDVRDVHLHFRAASVIDAISPLLQPALSRQLDEPAVRSIINDVVKRETDGTTNCGPLGLPHARSEAVKDFVLSIGVNAEGVIAGQSEPRIMFAFVSPAAGRQDHLNFLAALARLSQNPALLEQIVRALTPEQVIESIRSGI